MKPALFNTPMTRAILDRLKTQTRRLIRPQPPEDAIVTFVRAEGPEGLCGMVWQTDHSRGYQAAPYQPGDVLWVRETWTSDNGKFYYRADFDSDFLDPCETLSGGYPGDCAYHPGCEGCARGPQRIRWRPSIHMPKEAARIFLRVTDVRVERLQDITGADIKAEGAEGKHLGLATRGAFSQLWNSTVKPADRDRFGWEANPWVFAYTFEQINKEETEK